MAYCPGDKIFAKVKGHPHWPSRINLLPEDVPIPKGKYPIFFYGTHEVYFLAPKDIYPYEKFKHKYGVPRNKAVFQAGLREIEENPDVLLYKKDPEAEDFLAQFYSFKRSCKDTIDDFVTTPVTEVQSQKRSKSTSAETEHERLAKRPHTEFRKSSDSISHHPPQSSQGSRRSSLTKFAKQSPTTTNSSPVKPHVRLTDVTKSGDYVPVDSRRVSALRLRIRKQSTVLVSPDSISPSSPSTLGSTNTLEAHHISERSQASPNDPLKIIIRQNAAISPLVSLEETTRPRPIVSVTPTPSTGSGSNTNHPDIHRTRSTAVVTPLLRNVLPELSDDSSDSVTSANDVDLKMDSTDNKRKQSILMQKTVTNSQDSDRATYSTDNIRLRKRPSKQGRYSTEFFIFTDVKNSRKTSPSVSPKLSSRNWEKSPVDLTSKSIIVRTSPIANSDPNVIIQSNTVSNFDDQITKDKEQQLKDLDAEERLLLIDRSIKSSLIQGHEDIVACVDRLEFLDKMTISLPIMARCWTVVETIRKCRRYKRSLEVKIAAQKVFNKFLQLYATADKNELDLAHAELMKHQQRHMKKHSVSFNKGDSLESVSVSDTSIPPYMGPKSMADLFQMTVRYAKGEITDAKKVHDETAKNTSEALQSPTSVDATPNSSLALERYDLSVVNIITSVANKSPTQPIATTVCESQSNTPHSPLKVGCQIDVSVQDIPLPEEAPTQFILSKETIIDSIDVMPTGEDIGDIPATESVEEEFELLDVYEEPDSANTIQQSNCTFPVLQFSSDPDNFTKAENISQSAAKQSGPSFIPMSDVSCCPSSKYLSTYQPRSYITNSSVFAYPALANAQVQHSFNNHGHLLNNYSSPSHLHRAIVDATPPQSSSRAYIPHSLHPSEDPPPPYRPYIPTRCDVEQTQEFVASPDLCLKLPRECSQSYSITNGGGFSESISTTKHSRIDSDRRKIHAASNPSSISRETRTPPHRGRSPHALPHPLEHYQRYLNSALSSNDEMGKNGTSTEFTHNTVQSPDTILNSKSSLDDSKSDVLKSHISPINDNSHTEIPFISPSAEDLDTRIARLYDLAMRRNNTTTPNTQEVFNEAKSQKSITNSLVSPPPPPPPLPTSQRILFTHRPQNPLHLNISNSPTPLSSQQEPRMPSRHINFDNGNSGNRAVGIEPIAFIDQMNSDTLCGSSSSSCLDPGNIGINLYASPKTSFVGSDRQTRNMSSNFTLDFIHSTSQLYPRQSFNNHPQNARHYSINPRHNCHTTTTTTTTQNHPQFPCLNSNRMKSASDPLFPNRRRTDRDEDRDIYSMLGV
ncbi:hypothetical protein MN116_002935 [Schistosoma mekongi]|uniref:PWWP domain-containing protein n=1 Tax=Schistosoma mekongi TaxID=38744 RepID=A0AAE1ZHQ4_SCHME|nr:hypothetical protein MN116_002935 [Schistosoma mekongi]